MQKHIGLVLESMREDHGMSQLSLVKALEANGYVMSMGAYVEIEAGSFLPDDCEAFLDAYKVAMHLSHEELVRVVKHLAHDLLKREFGDMGEDFARQILG